MCHVGPRTLQPKRPSFSAHWILSWAVTYLQQGGQHVQNDLVVIFLIRGFKHFVYMIMYATLLMSIAVVNEPALSMATH